MYVGQMFLQIINRDLEARNVFVGERETCKVTDFGMARDVQQKNIYERKTNVWKNKSLNCNCIKSLTRLL